MGSQVAFPAQIRKDKCHYMIYSAGIINYFQEKEIQANKCKEGLARADDQGKSKMIPGDFGYQNKLKTTGLLLT